MLSRRILISLVMILQHDWAGGVDWIRELCVVEELRSGRLIALKTARLSLERPLYSLRLRGRHLNPSALVFMQSFEQTRR
jgi:hypothetical protein